MWRGWSSNDRMLIKKLTTTPKVKFEEAQKSYKTLRILGRAEWRARAVVDGIAITQIAEGANYSAVGVVFVAELALIAKLVRKNMSQLLLWWCLGGETYCNTTRGCL